jgi:hypothetical protein
VSSERIETMVDLGRTFIESVGVVGGKQ